MIDILIAEPFQRHISEDFLQKTAQTALQHQGVNLETINTSIVIDDDKLLRELNNQYRKIDHPTDVLSFPADELDPETNRTNLGDIIISFPQAEDQARDAQHTVQDEIQLLVVHGILHLLGFDHATKAEKAIMWKHQENIIHLLDTARNA